MKPKSNSLLPHHLALVFLIFLQAQPTSQLEYIPLKPRTDVLDENNRVQFRPIREKHYDNVVKINMDKITKAMNESGYKSLSIRVESHIPYTVPYGYNELNGYDLFLFNNTVKIYTPVRGPREVKHEVVLSRADSGVLTDGWSTCRSDDVCVTQVPNYDYPPIHHVKIAEWEMCNDDEYTIGMQEYFYINIP